MALQLGVLVLFAVVAVTVFLIGDRIRPKSWRHGDDKAAGNMVLDLVNMFFAAIVAFIVVILWQQYDDTHAHTIAEGKALTTVYEAANNLPEPGRSQIQSLTRAYTEEVVGQEWKVMANDSKLSQPTQDTFDNIRAAVSGVQSTDPDVKDLQSKADAALDAAAEARYDRGIDAEYHLPTFLYVALWFGTVMLLIGTVLSGVVVTRRSVVMTGLFGMVIGAVIVAVYQLDRPFAGGNTVSKDAFELALSRFQHITASGASSSGLPR